MQLRPAQPEDAEAILAILHEPEVARWWYEYSRSDVLEELPNSLVIVVDDEVVGWLQCHEEDDEQYPSVGFDIAISTRLHGRGLGRRALAEASRRYVERGHHRFTIDPDVDNEPAIRCYAAIGFEPVGVMRRYLKRPDGSYRDGLLMDLLADELVLPFAQ